MSFPPLLGPRAPERNPPIEPQFYEPSRFTISNIQYGTLTTVTNLPSFGVNNNYVIGQLVRLTIPSFYGANGLNEQTAYVVGIPQENTVILNLDTSLGYSAFIPNPPYGPTPPSIQAIGDINTGIISSTGRFWPEVTIPGAFRDVSPFPS